MRSGMDKSVTAYLGVQMPLEIKEALQRAAKADHRTLSSKAIKILEDWLRDNGFL